MARPRLLIAVAALAFLAAAPPSDWQSPLQRDHPLVGTIWDVAGARALTPEALVKQLAARRYVLLGEKHDNVDHHRLQAWVIDALVAAGRRPAVALEMLRADQADALARHLAAAPTDAAGLGDAVDWRRSGWPAWPTYAPIAEAALRARLPIVAANLSQAATTSLRQGGTAAIDPALVTRLELDRPAPDDLRQGLARELRAGHCGHLPEGAIDGFVLVQRARDAHMAAALRDAGGDGAVLIAGAGHVRRDLGVPRALPAGETAALAFVEVDAGTPAPPASAPFDYLWFTPRVDERDPCERFRRSLERLRQP